MDLKQQILQWISDGKPQPVEIEETKEPEVEVEPEEEPINEKWLKWRMGEDIDTSGRFNMPVMRM